MKNILIMALAIAATFMFTACEKTDLQSVGKETLTTQKNQQAFLNDIQNLKEGYLETANTYRPSSSSTARSNQSDVHEFSMEEATPGMSFLVEGASIHEISNCTVTITDNGDFNTYAFTAIDRFEETDDIATYSFEYDISKKEQKILPRAFSFIWPKFSAWPVPKLLFFASYNEEIVAEDATQIVIDVPLNAPFVLNSAMIDVDTGSFEFEEFEGVVRITGLKTN